MSRVLMVVRPSDGGAFEHVRALAGELAARGHEVALCGPHAARREELPVEVIDLDIVRPLRPWADTRAIASLRRIVRRRRPDVVHAHGSKGGVMARLARAANPRVPVVFTPHGFAFAGFFSSAAERRTYRGIERALAPLASRFACVCEAEARLARSVGAGSRARVVHNGIAAPAEPTPSAAIAGLRGDGPLLGVLSGLRPGKGLEAAIEAMGAITASVPGTRLVIGGEGPERGELEALVRAGGLEGAVLMPGFQADPYGFIAALDLFLFPSLAESFPYSILEAMAMGRPIVASDVGGVGEAVEDGAGGLLVAPGDPHALALAVTDLLTEPARAAAMGRAARLRQEERFTLSRMVDGMLGVYAEVA